MKYKEVSYSGIYFIAGVHRQISLSGNNYMASNNTNNPCPKQNQLGLMSQALSSYDIQLQRQLCLKVAFILCKLDPVGFIKHRVPDSSD